MENLSFIEEHKELLEIITPFISSLLGAFIGGIGVFFTVFRNSKNAQKQLLVQTISEERIKWINALRDEFVEFNTNLAMYEEIKPESKEGLISKKERERYENLLSSIDKITLMINPSEYYMEYLTIKINELLQVKSTSRGSYDLNAFLNSRDKMIDLQQIILKAEWRRVKEESSTGKELSSQKTMEIYNEIAISINPEVQDFVNDWIQIEEDSKKMSEEEFYEKHFRTRR